MKKLSPIYILIAGILWGTMGLFVRGLGEGGLSTMDIVALRSVGTSLLLGIYLLIFNRRLFRIRLKDVWCFLGTGIVSIVFFNYCYFKTMTLTSLSVAAVMLYTAPAFVMVMSFFLFKEKLGAVKLVALFLTIMGCVLVTGLLTGTQNLTAVGILTGLGAGIGYALYSIFSRFAIERGYPIFTTLFYTFVFASIGSIPLCHIGRTASYVASSVSNVGFALLYALVSTVLPYFFYTKGLERVENGPASIIASIEPVVATLIGVFVLGEEMTIMNLLGMLLVLAAIVICNLRPAGKKEKVEA